MRKQSMFIGMICLIASFILVSCDFGANDTVQDIKSEINQETPKEDIEDLGITQVSEQKIGDELAISSNFSGYVYVMSTKENIETIRKTDFSFNNNPFKSVEKGSYHDFNIRYHGKTYFAIKQIIVESINSLKISSDYTGKILLVLRGNNS